MKKTSLEHYLSLRSVQPSATLAINELSKKLERKGRKIIKFGFGQSPFPIPEEVVEALRSNAHQKSYLPVQGLEELRAAVASYYLKHYDLHTQPQQIMIGPGSKELLFLIQMVAQTGLLLPAPSWVSYAPQAFLAQKDYHYIQTKESEDWHLTAEELEGACIRHPEHRLLILNSPNNPSGTTLDSHKCRALATVARKFNLVIVSDEIYGPLNFDNQAPTFASFYPEATIVTGGLSKWCGAGGWRLGTAVFPEPLSPLLEAVKAAASETFTAVSAPVQYAAIHAYRFSPGIEKYLDDCRIVLKHISRYVHQRLTQLRVNAVLPHGGFYIFPDFNNYRDALLAKGIQNNRQLCESLLQETGVALLPSADFGRSETEYTARLAFVDFDGAYALKWLDQNRYQASLGDDLVSACCPQVAQGMDKLSGWLNQL